MTQVAALVAQVDWTTFAVGALARLLIACVVWRFAPSVPVLTGVVTINGKPLREFGIELTTATGVLVRTTGQRGMYRILDMPPGKVTLTFTSPASTPNQTLVLSGELQKRYAQIDVDVPVTIDAFTLSSSGANTEATIRMGMSATDAVAARGATATLDTADLKYHAMVSPKTVSAATLATPEHDFALTLTSLATTWTVGSGVPPGSYRAEVSLSGVANSTAKKDATV